MKRPPGYSSVYPRVNRNTYVNLEFFLGEQRFKERFYVTGLGKQKIILGFPWLHKYNPIIDWKKGEITFKSTGDTLWKKANKFDRTTT
jgi:hypothetical protein